MKCYIKKFALTILSFVRKFRPKLFYQIDPSPHKKSKVVTTVLNAKWANTPLVMEAAEVLAEENAEFFWDFLDFLSDKRNIELKRMTGQEIYESVISFASR
jgi:hypothetical protein